LLSREVDRDQFGGRCGIQIRSAKTRGSLETSRPCSGRRLRRSALPRAGSRRAGGAVAVFGKVHHGASLSNAQKLGKRRCRRRHRRTADRAWRPIPREMADAPDHETYEPEPQAQPDGAGQRAVGDGEANAVRRRAGSARSAPGERDIKPGWQSSWIMGGAIR
jgi:hypothetical protein